MTNSVKLAIGGFIIVGVTAYMAYVGAASSWKYYVTSDECVANAGQLVGSRMRVSGKVAEGSLQRSANSRQATFLLCGTDRNLQVIAAEPLPDNLAEGMDVVVEGRLESVDLFRGDKVLTRCASKYESGDKIAAGQEAPEFR